jgi:uncharacterized membrane protein
MIFLLALLIGAVAGLRTMTAPTAVGWAAWSGRLGPSDGWLAFLGHAVSPWVFTTMAIAELVIDKLPMTPSRKTPVQFGARLVSGALSGAAVGEAGGSLLVGAALGVVGAAGGTLGGAAGRAWLAKRIGMDWPAAVVEDAVAIGSATLLMLLVPARL